MTKPFANSGDPDQTPRSAASDLGLHCLSITLLRVSRLQWVKFKPGHSISYKIACAATEDSEQHVHPRSLIGFFAVRLKALWFLGYPRVPCEASDQTAHPRSLI